MLTSFLCANPDVRYLFFPRAVLTGALVVSLAACGSDGNGNGPNGPEPTTGAIEVATLTTGDQPDPDGYQYQIDGGGAQAIGVTDTLVVPDLEPGSHQVVLSDVADNCDVNLGTTRNLTVAVGDTVRAPFELSCFAPQPPTPLDVVFFAPGATPPGIYGITFGGTRRELLFEGNALSDPEFSPDSSKIAFVNGTDIWVMDGDGSNAALFVNDFVNPTWSSGSDSLAFQTAGGAGISVMGLNETQPTLLVANGTSPAWSPDGSRIGFFSFANGLEAIDPDGQNRTTISSGTLGNGLAWSPDGNFLLYSASDLGGTDIFMIDSDGTDQARFTNAAGGSFTSLDPAFDPLGSRVIFTRIDNGSGDEAVWVIDFPSGNNLLRVAEGNDPHWQQ